MAGLLSVKQVAEVMQVSERQVSRWKASYREKGKDIIRFDVALKSSVIFQRTE